MVKCDNRSFDGDSSLSKPHQGKYLNKIWDFLILRFSFWMLLMQIEFHAFPSVLSWFHGASFKPLFAAIEEAFPSHFFRFFHHLTASSPQAWQFSPSWLCFVVLVFFKKFLTILICAVVLWSLKPFICPSQSVEPQLQSFQQWPRPCTLLINC